MTGAEELAAKNLALVHHVAVRLKRIIYDPVEYDDLVSAGYLGLRTAARDYDPGLGTAFSTFAVPRIRGAMLDDLRRRDGVARSVRTKGRAHSAATNALGHELGRAPTAREVRERLAISPEQFERDRVRLLEGSVASLDEMLRGRGEDGSPRFQPATPAAPLLAELDDEASVAVRRAVAQLPEKERFVIVRYYWHGERQLQIAQTLGVTESRVCQIRARACRRLALHLSDYADAA